MTNQMDDLMRPYAWHTEDHLTDRTATTYSKDMAYRWECKGWPVVPMFTADQMLEYAEQVRKDYSFTHAQMWLRRFHDGIAAENEACAKVCETKLGPTATGFYGKTYAAYIRERLQGIQSENCNCPGFCTGACERGNV